MFEVLKRAQWEESLVDEYVELLMEVPCNVADVKVPNGMRYHVIDIYVDEVEKAGALEEDEERDVRLEKLLSPLRRLAKESPTKTVRTKAKEALEDERLPGNEKTEEDEAEKEAEAWGGIEE